MNLLAMSVDFGWPWWAFTAIAVGVVAASAVLLFLVRDRVAKGGLAVLLVEGIAVAALAPALMTGSGHTGSAMSPRITPVANTAMTRTEFAQAGDANCRALSKHIASTGNPKTLPGVVRKLDVVIPAYSMALRAQAELRPPQNATHLSSRWMGAMTQYGHALRDLRAAARAGDASGVGKANKELGVLGGKNARLSKELGLRVCFQQ